MNEPLREQLAKELISLPVGDNKLLCWDIEVLLDYITSQIHTTLVTLQTAVLAVAPAEQPVNFVSTSPSSVSYKSDRDAVGHGYNQAVDQYTTALQQLFESEG